MLTYTWIGRYLLKTLDVFEGCGELCCANDVLGFISSDSTKNYIGITNVIRLQCLERFVSSLIVETKRHRMFFFLVGCCLAWIKPCRF